MSLCITLHWWHLAAYIAIGCGLLLPLSWLAWRRWHWDRLSYLDWLNDRPERVPVMVALWPVALCGLVRLWRSARP